MSIEVFTDNCFLFDKEMKIDYDGFLKNMKNQESNTKIFVLLSFNSYSQAKKTLDSIKKSNLLVYSLFSYLYISICL